ncbi:MAG: hypothetical protein AAGB00_06745 [Planctomycetota bacterium]
MNTPAHVIASCVLIPHKPGWPATSALVVGALAPDLPMFGFYAYQKLLRGRSEAEVWSNDPAALGLYFNPEWQLFFDWFNSLPLLAVLAAVCRLAGWQWGLLCAASALLHIVCDLPLHHDDAHRHFLPLTDWRFISPVSYWDPNHYGRFTLPLELLLTIAGCVYLVAAGQPAPSRTVGWATLTIYAAFACLAAAMWGGLLIGPTGDDPGERPRPASKDSGVR